LLLNFIHSTHELIFNRMREVKMRSALWKAMTLAAFSAGATFVGTAQTSTVTPNQPDLVAHSNPPSTPSTDTGTKQASSATQPETQLTVDQKIAILENRIEQLEDQVKQNSAAAVESRDDAAALTAAEKALVAGNGGAALHAAVPAAAAPLPAQAQRAPAAAAAPATPPPPDIPGEITTKSAPFAYADWTWLNGNPRTEDTPLATKYFTPEFRADVNYTYDFNKPSDDSLGGSTETFRANEIQVEQLSFGGDLRVNNVRGRFLTMYGMFATTTPRNDPSVSRGQWDLADAYRYISEAWGGYHWNVAHGVNLDGGIFVSYIGLFSYYNFDNWAYQPSYVSSNTPWFFNGLRLQYFPTAKLKIEPWFINGWQSYARSNSKPGLGGQILYRPRPWISIVTNNYGLGQDAPGILSGGATATRSRIHTDNSVEVKYYDRPSSSLDKMAFSLTGDLGCEMGGGVKCTGGHLPGPPKQAFLGWMAYNRFWFKKDLFGLTLGGGQMNNPGRYLTLLPPINGATASSGTPYFTENPGDKMRAYDATGTLDYMPNEFITFRWEWGYRHTDVPYWTGHGGITPPGGNNGSPQQYACTVAGPGGNTASGFTDLPDAQNVCAGFGGAVWFPDLRTQQASSTFAIMVKF
jgi:hypothetical protein